MQQLDIGRLGTRQYLCIGAGAPGAMDHADLLFNGLRLPEALRFVPTKAHTLNLPGQHLQPAGFWQGAVYVYHPLGAQREVLAVAVFLQSSQPPGIGRDIHRHGEGRHHILPVQCRMLLTKNAPGQFSEPTAFDMVIQPVLAQAVRQQPRPTRHHAHRQERAQSISAIGGGFRAGVIRHSRLNTP